jgi:hypothetical protein
VVRGLRERMSSIGPWMCTSHVREDLSKLPAATLVDVVSAFAYNLAVRPSRR